jgi:hypothetical protein
MGSIPMEEERVKEQAQKPMERKKQKNRCHVKQIRE